MNTARRWYIHLVCAISLQSVTWAVIALLRNLLAGGRGTTGFIAFQISVIIIALPLFIVHWLWAQRLAERDINEREASLRGLYLYGMAGGFLGAGIANAYSLFANLFWLAIGKPKFDYYEPLENPLYYLLALLVLGALFHYQQRVLAEDAKVSPETGVSATIRRLYMFVFSAWGLTMTALAIIHLLRWIMYQFGLGMSIGFGTAYMTDEVARLLVGAPLWLFFWRQAQTRFHEPSEEERESALRKFYLYASVFISVLTVVTNATIILASFFRRLLGLESMGDIREPLPLILGMGLVWAYHAHVLRGEASREGEAPRQAGIRRLYRYLVAAVGLAAFLVGLSGDLSVLIRSLSQFFSDTLREQLAWFTAALIAGLPVWLVPWRQAQVDSLQTTPAGADERRSAVRKYYLYFYLLVATLAVLSSAVYVLYRLLSLALGERPEADLGSNLGQALAYALVGIGVWLYHGSAIREDGLASRRDETARMEKVRAVFIGLGGDEIGQALVVRLQKELPGFTPHMISLPLEGETAAASLIKIGEADLIVGQWPVAVAGGAGGTVSPEVAQAVVFSPGHKLLIPSQVDGWDWAGVERLNAESALTQTARAIKQFMEGEEIKPQRPMTVGGVIGTIIGVLLLLVLLVIPVLSYFLD